MEIARGLPGEQGEKGDPARPYKDQGDIANQAAIDLLELSLDDEGKAWRNLATNALHYWTGYGWIVHANAFGVAGPQGPFGALAEVTIEMVDPEDDPEAILSGGPGSQSMHVKIPATPGPIGPTGTPGAIEVAPDYADGGTPAVTGDSLIKRSDGKWGPGKMRGPVGPYSNGPGQFTAVSTTFDARRLISSIALPVLPYATYLDLDGMLRVDNKVLGASVGVEVRLGNEETGVIIGKGLNTTDGGDHVVRIGNWYSSNVAPNSPTTIQIPANHTGTQGTVYVSAVRVSGLGSWSCDNAEANLTIRRFPA
ncbi:hypothetical protein CJ179_38295 [Rhodococcus sp. ACS1]|nr:hypothetical protein CJ179_38295 [Rhodococcus sp. ACS1]